MQQGRVNKFSDTAGTTHEEAIESLAERGILEGFEDGTFRPHLPVTRGQLAAIIHRALEVEGSA